MNDLLPRNWIEFPIGDIALITDFVANGSFASLRENVQYINSPDFAILIRLKDFNLGWKGHFIYVNQQAYEFLSKSALRPGDLVIANVGDPGRLFLVPDLGQAMTLGPNGILIRADQSITSNIFLASFFSSLAGQKSIKKIVTGSAQQKFNKTEFRKILVPIPPLLEQQRIQQKLDNILPKVQACQERLDKIQAILKRFRQAVLAAACSGRLTEDWREKNLDVSNENIEIINNEDNPVGWKVVCIGDVIESLKYGTAHKCSYEKKGVPVLRIPNVVNGFIDQTDLKYAELSTKEFNQLRLIPGDILIIRSNGSVSLVGKSAIIREQESDFAYAGYLIRIRPNKTKIEPEFLNLSLRSYYIRLQIELEARSTSGVNNINGDEVRALRLNLPPLKEQQEIIRQAEKYLTLADKIEARCERTQTYLKKLTQSILSKAFRGELVPQDPNDEPASVLLKKLQKAKKNKKD
ncbi:MAG: restriction endonuclease subunit S [Bacteroidota bacterium]